MFKIPFWFDVCRQDLRYGFRQLRRAPLFTIVTIAALSIGVGANITVFSLVNGWLLRPLDAANPDQLVRITGPGGDTTGVLSSDNEAHISTGDYVQYRDLNQTFSALAAGNVGGPTSVRWNGPAQMIPVTPVTGNYFEMLGVRAAMGRVLTPEDARFGAREVVVLSDVGWHRYFRAAPDIVGTTIVVDGVSHVVAGVLPAWFTGTTAPLLPQIYRAIPERGGQLAFSWRVQLLGRLKPGVTPEQARADLVRIATHLDSVDHQRRAIEIYAARTTFPVLYRALALGAVMFGLIVLVVLLITCDNIAVLTAIRAAARSPEIGVRLALGASRARIVFQLVVEMALLCGAAGIIGMYLAFATARFATQFYLPVPMPFALTFKPDWRVFAFAVVASSAATMLCGLVPALKTLNTDLVAIVKGAGLKPRMQSGLVTAQVTLSTALLITAAVLAHSVIANVSRPRSFASDGVVMTTMALPDSRFTPERRFTMLRTLLETVEHSAGVSAASIVFNVPVANNAATTPVEVRANGRVARAQVNVATRGLFRTLSVPMLAGRDFLPADDTNPAAVAIINESLARAFWADGNPVGETLLLGNGTSVRVIGLVRDIETEPSTRRVMPMLYRPLAYEPPMTATVLFKVARNAAALVPLVRSSLTQLDPDIGAYSVMWLDERLDLGLVLNRAAAITGGVLGLLALALGAFGIYGTIASVVQQRRREIGIRLALGASRLDVVRLISTAGMRSSVAGVACGLALGALGTLGLSRTVQGVTAVDLPAFVVIAALLLVVSCVACYLPARRGSRVSITAALREE